jgi:hypothetical protein
LFQLKSVVCPTPGLPADLRRPHAVNHQKKDRTSHPICDGPQGRKPAKSRFAIGDTRSPAIVPNALGFASEG